MEAVARWRGQKLTREIASDLSHYAAGLPLAECKTIGGLLGDHMLALEWVAQWYTPLLFAYRQDDLGEAPFRANCTEACATVQLLASGNATLNLTAYGPIESPRTPQSALLVDRESVELLLEGEVHALLQHKAERNLRKSRLQSAEITLRAGETISLSRDSARHFIQSNRSCLVLQLARSAKVPRPTRKVRLADGQVLKSASGDKQASRDLMALAVLGVADDERSAQLFSDIALDTARDPEVRWEAVRQLLAKDVVAGIRLIDQLSGSSCEVLSGAAKSLNRQLQALPLRPAPNQNEAA